MWTRPRRGAGCIREGDLIMGSLRNELVSFCRASTLDILDESVRCVLALHPNERSGDLVIRLLSWWPTPAGVVLGSKPVMVLKLLKGFSADYVREPDLVEQVRGWVDYDHLLRADFRLLKVEKVLSPLWLVQAEPALVLEEIPRCSVCEEASVGSGRWASECRLLCDFCRPKSEAAFSAVTPCKLFGRLRNDLITDRDRPVLEGWESEYLRDKDAEERRQAALYYQFSKLRRLRRSKINPAGLTLTRQLAAASALSQIERQHECVGAP